MVIVKNYQQFKAFLVRSCLKEKSAKVNHLACTNCRRVYYSEDILPVLKIAFYDNTDVYKIYYNDMFS
ncbi:hypothetical protein SDC9_27697 [bioreactor metagenome]|jgi:hypothetical protein|uniref:Uncharacterized protein n=1 Tax=bioreactor metagenome TaxID=1076179 RepID=A0A644URX6_9ZZZZ